MLGDAETPTVQIAIVQKLEKELEQVKRGHESLEGMFIEYSVCL